MINLTILYVDVTIQSRIVTIETMIDDMYEMIMCMCIEVC